LHDQVSAIHRSNAALADDRASMLAFRLGSAPFSDYPVWSDIKTNQAGVVSRVMSFGIATYRQGPQACRVRFVETLCMV
jgi:hypothetical protein